jgi:GT2 family glycosyltransferase
MKEKQHKKDDLITQRNALIEEVNRLNKEKSKFKALVRNQELEIEHLEKKIILLHKHTNNSKPRLKFSFKGIAFSNKSLLNWKNIKSFWPRMGNKLKSDDSKIYDRKTENLHIAKAEKISPSDIKVEKPDNPAVSIILSINNDFEKTLRCLHKIQLNTKDILYEIIVPVNGLDQHTKENLLKIEEIQFLSSDSDYIGSLNKAVENARGEYVVFLDSNYQVQDGWLKNLLKVSENDPGCGIVEPKIVFVDGRLMHAGGIIHNDATLTSYGKLDDSEKYEYNYLKETDYISGACFLIRKTIWEELCGMGPEFETGIYKYVDLVFRIRQAGYKVFYQPTSLVVGSSATNTNTFESVDAEKEQEKNRQRFLNRWKRELMVKSSPKGHNVFLHRDRSLVKAHLLVIDHAVPYFDQDDASRLTFNYLELFVKMGYQVHFIGHTFYRHEPYTTQLQQLGIEVIYGKHHKQNISDWFQENGKFIDFSIVRKSLILPKYAKLISQYCDSKLAFIIEDSQLLKNLQKLELNDIPELNYSNEHIKPASLKVLDDVDILLTFSDFEYSIIKKWKPEKKVFTIPGRFYEIHEKEVPDFGDRKDILMMGDIATPENMEALQWFTDKVFPLILQNVPDVMLHVFCSKPDLETQILNHAHVHVISNVSGETTLQYYSRFRLAVFPQQRGPASKNELLDCLYHQLPTVITPSIAAGTPEIDKHSFVAYDPESFAGKVCDAYTDTRQWNRLSEGGIELISKHYTGKAARKIFEKIIDKAIKKDNRRNHKDSYQKRDYNVIDYKLWNMEGFSRSFRGPEPKSLLPEKHFVCFGAAQTFGVYVEKPYPALISKKTGMEHLNLGYSGAGPAFFLKDHLYFEYANKAKFAIVQIMSGRSESNSCLVSLKGRGGVTRIKDNKKFIASKGWEEILRNEPEEFVVELVNETRANYTLNMIELLNKIKVPKILLWFSERKPEYRIGFENTDTLFGKYPQLINQKVVDDILPFADFFVDATSTAGMPQKLSDRFTGETPITYGNPDSSVLRVQGFNDYYSYPSPEMHQLAYKKLITVCWQLISS